MQRPYFYCHHCHCGRYPLDEVLGLSAGRMAYLAKRLLVLGDGGGSNGATQYLFKEDLQGLANQLGRCASAHYPPYCSKHNPIEHQVFPHITRACQG